MDSFTQLDIEKNVIKYKTHRHSYSNFQDVLTFFVSVSECDDVFGELIINYKTEESIRNRISFQRKEDLHVKEGDVALILKNHFDLLFDDFDSLLFVVSEMPKHGALCHYDISRNQIENVSQFQLEKLYMGDVYYCHDNSESQSDTLNILILSNEKEDFQYVSQISVRISLINDNAPYRLSEDIFHVVRDSERIITEKDLLYVDDDIDTKSSDIHYTHVTCLNGEFYKLGRYVDQFSQNDIKSGKIIFRHNGPLIGTASYIVTDGLHEVPGILEIQASDPFISIHPSNATIVQEGKYVTLKPDDITIRTNLDATSNQVFYIITKSPTYGFLKFLDKSEENKLLNYFGNQTSIQNFTQDDLDQGTLLYFNTEVASMDKISYRVIINNISADGEILIRIYPAAYWEPLQVRKNRTVFVEESTSVVISKDILEVIHPNISPGDITFLVTSLPQHGYLETHSLTSDDDYNCKIFDQSSINSEKIFYIQAGVNQSTDFFIFDVTNGITWLKGLMLKIIIIPENLYIDAKSLTVVEDKMTTLNYSIMQPYSEYYKSKILEYKIIQQPSFGYIMVVKSKVTRFTQKQLESDLVYYVHDGSENYSDSVTIVAISRNKESLPFVIKIDVIPVNDEPPVVVTNTGLHLWNGGIYVIKNSDIMVRDYDSPPEELHFLINHVYGGYLSYKNNTQLKIDQFTQNDINNENICFIHDSNAKRNEISFIVTDGIFNTTEQILYIVVKPVTLKSINKQKLHVFPLTRKQILSEHLYYQCSDEIRPIRYNVTIPPALGRLIYEYPESGHTIEINEFSQNDIDNGKILYEHTTLMLELRTNDSFFFDVFTENTNPLIDQIFDIEISVSSGGLARFLPVSKLHIDEGSSTPIKLDFNKILEYLKSKAGLKNPDLYIEAYKPKYGNIKSINKTNFNIFYPNDFINQRVLYSHDHSDTTSDTIFMSIYLQQGNILLCNLSIPVVINPINDQPFYLITQSPYITLVEGENKTITDENLLTTDIDTLPEDIMYDIISEPTSGTLSKISNNGTPVDILAYDNKFSQADINNKRIIYTHYGIPKSTTFYFKVSDGKYKPTYKIFNINIEPIYITSNDDKKDVLIKQGLNTGIIQMEHFGINTNAHLSRLRYNISNSPLSGIILHNHQPTLYFNHDQLINREIVYMQTDMSKANDTFQVYAYIANTMYGIMCEIKVKVEPFVKINAISVIGGDKIRLSSVTTVDNTVILIKHNPKISIIKQPEKGLIRKIIRNTGETEISNEKNVTSFTFKELKGGVVYYVANTLPDGITSITDRFEYLIYIKSVQPAQSAVLVNIQAFNTPINSIHTTINLERANTSALNYIVLVCTLSGIVVLIFVILIIIRSKYKNKKKDIIGNDPPPPLPRPPDFVGLNNNQIYSPSESESFPATSASTPLPCLSNIPHCKVTPIGNHDQEIPDYDMDEDTADDIDETHQMVPNQYQPYVEQDDWTSSCGLPNEFDYAGSVQHQTTNPLLRRNQYWV